jgi:hypothetical protein
MPTHRFKEGAVIDAQDGGARLIPPGRYKIIRLMPPTVAGNNQYRIKSLKDGHERLVVESDLPTASP